MAPTPDPGFGFGAEAFWRNAPGFLQFGFKGIWDLEVTGAERPQPPFVAAANHYSHLDVVLVGKELGPVRYLAVDELYRQSVWFDRLITYFGAIPMSRVKVPLTALKTALQHLGDGGVVGLFPEGRRVWTWGEAELKRGAAWLAMRAEVPLLPVAIWGTQESFGRGARRIKRWPVRMEICEPLQPTHYRGSDDPTRDMMRDWEGFIDEALERLRRR